MVMNNDTTLSFISEDVVRSLMYLYGNKGKLDENSLLGILSRPPKTTVLRINTNYITPEDALKRCEEFLDFQSKSTDGQSYCIKLHPMLRDVVVIAAQHFKSNPQQLEKEVIVDSACGSAVLRGADIYIPGVLAAHPGMQPGDEVSVFVDVEKKCRKGFTKEFDGPKLFIGNGVAKFSRDEIFINNGGNISSGVGIIMKNKIFNLPSFNGLDASMFFPQNLPSILVGHMLSVQENDVVLDMCAAPGGKTTHIASLMKGKGTLISIDKTPQKVARIQENLKNLKLSNVQCFCYDSTKLLASATENNTDQSARNGDSEIISFQPPFRECSFDKILLDPPCSGVGQRPQLRYTLNEKELSSYPKLQRKLFKQAVPLLKSGGDLVYSTCTLLPQENEEQVSWALETFPELELVDQQIKLGRAGLPGYGILQEDIIKVQRFDRAFVDDVEQTDILDICHNDTIGFFIAKFSKKLVQ